MDCEIEQRLNLSHPLQARKWLRLLQENQVSGIRMRPSLSLDSSYFGFSFSSNALGLRGPANQDSGSVMMGTSFTMGLGVNVGRNWYECDSRFSNWLNLGLPVGILEWLALLSECHEGRRDRLLILYHPNIWNMSWQYAKWRASGRPVFDYFGWKTGRLSCWRLALQRAVSMRGKIAKGELLRFQHGQFDYQIPTRFTFFNWRGKEEFVATILNELRSGVRSFKEALIVRVPVKQQLVPKERQNPTLTATHANYDELWQKTAESLAGVAGCVELEGFDLDDYLPRDVHWNERGNRKAASLLASHLGAKR